MDRQPHRSANLRSLHRSVKLCVRPRAGYSARWAVGLELDADRPEPARVLLALDRAAAPFVWSEVRLQTATCAGQGKSVAGRFSRFQCTITFGDVNMSSPYGAELLVRVLPVGTGKLCVVAGPDGKAVKPTGGTAGVDIAVGRARPA